METETSCIAGCSPVDARSFWPFFIVQRARYRSFKNLRTFISILSPGKLEFFMLPTGDSSEDMFMKEQTFRVGQKHVVDSCVRSS